MKAPHPSACLLALALLFPPEVSLQAAQDDSLIKFFGGGLMRLTQIIQPPTNEPPRTFTTRLKILKAEGLPGELAGREIEIAFQAPDHLRLSAQWEHQDVVIARNQQEVWIDVPGKKLGLVGAPEVPRFATDPQSTNDVPL